MAAESKEGADKFCPDKLCDLEGKASHILLPGAVRRAGNSSGQGRPHRTPVKPKLQSCSVQGPFQKLLSHLRTCALFFHGPSPKL